MKKFLSIILSLAMIFSISASAFAAESGNITKKTVSQDGYTFEISEQVDSNFKVVRSYEKPQNSVESREALSEESNLDETKALLVALGMQERSVEKLSYDTLQEFSDGETIYVSTAYTKVNETGVVSPLSASTAIEEANTLKAQQNAIYMDMAQGVALAADYSDYFEDSYMRVDFAASYQGDGAYLYSVDGEWLTMPFFRGFDSIGSCAMNGTVTNSTRDGYYSYDITYVNLTGNTYDTYEDDITSVKNAITGNWYGSAGVFNLPNNVYGEYSSILYDNFFAHYEYQGHVTSPSEPRWFNTVASYDHATISIAFSPSVSIDLGGDVSASIGLAIVGTTDTRSVEFEIYYPGE